MYMLQKLFVFSKPKVFVFFVFTNNMTSSMRIRCECNYRCKHSMEGFAMVHPRTARLHAQHDEHGKTYYHRQAHDWHDIRDSSGRELGESSSMQEGATPHDVETIVPTTSVASQPMVTPSGGMEFCTCRLCGGRRRVSRFTISRHMMAENTYNLFMRPIPTTTFNSSPNQPSGLFLFVSLVIIL